jgi:hypothetical protein
MSVIDGRETLSSEVHRETPALRTYIQDAIGRLLSENAFVDALSGYLLPDPVSQSRISIVLSRLEDLAAGAGRIG